ISGSANPPLHGAVAPPSAGDGCCPCQAIFVRSINKGCKQRMGGQWLRLEFGVELAAEKPGMVCEFDDLDEILVGGNAGNDQSVVGEYLLELPVELVSMTMPFRDYTGIVNTIGQRARLQICGIRATPHR